MTRSRVRARFRGYLGRGLPILLIASILGGIVGFQLRYDNAPDQTITLKAFSNTEYPEDPAERSLAFGNYPHRKLRIQQIEGTRFRFLIEPGSDHATTIELTEIDLAHIVAAVPQWVKSDPDLTRVGLIDREWNRQQVSFRRDSSYVRVHEGGDGFERQRLTRVDLARNCLNAGLWELLLFTVEDGIERVYEHVWFTFPLGLYKQQFERVNGLSYWDHWWSLEHWVDPAGTPIRLARLWTVEREWTVTATPQWDDAPSGWASSGSNERTCWLRPFTRTGTGTISRFSLRVSFLLEDIPSPIHGTRNSTTWPS